MENYIGVKLIEAEPMTRGDYNTHKRWIMPADENPADEGYLVRYNPTYESWSPKDVFDSAYLPIGDDSTRIKPPVINAMIATITASQVDPKTCLVKCETVTGFVQYETSACVAPENYDENLGKQIAGKKIEEKLWFALGFVLQWARYGLKKVNKTT
mgnify:CR=1 FL=1